MATIGTLLVNVAANTTQFQQGLNKARGMMAEFTHFVGKAGVASAVFEGVRFVSDKMQDLARSAFEMAKGQAEAVDSLGKMADRLGIATEEMAAFEHAAALSGDSVEEVEQSIQRFNRQLGEAASGNKEAQQAFAQLGLDPRELAGMKPGDAFWMTADAINGLGTAYDRAAAAQAVFGRGGGRMLTFLQTGSDGFRKMQAEAKAFGRTFSGRDFQAVQAMNDEITRAQLAMEGVARQLVIAAAPTIQVAAESVTAAFVGMGGGAENLKIHIDNLVFSWLTMEDQFVVGILAMDRAWAQFQRDFLGGLALIQQLVVTGDFTGAESTALGQAASQAAAENERIQQQGDAFRSAGGSAEAYVRNRRRIEQQSESLAAAIREETKALIAQQKATMDAAREAARLEKLRAGVTSPFVEFREKTKELLEAFQRGQLGGLGNFGRGMMQQLEGLRRLTGGGGGPPGLAMFGSREAFQSRVAFERGARDPAQEMIELLKQMVLAEKGQERAAQNLANTIQRAIDEGVITLP